MTGLRVAKLDTAPCMNHARTAPGMRSVSSIGHEKAPATLWTSRGDGQHLQGRYRHMNDSRTAPPSADWWRDAPASGHFVYYLCAPIPGVDDDAQIVYIGVTSNLRARLRAHSRKWWWSTIDPEMVTFDQHPTRAEADHWERQSIYWHQPPINRAGRLLVVEPLRVEVDE